MERREPGGWRAAKCRNIHICMYIEREGASVSIVDSSSIFKRKKTPGGMKYAKKGIPCTLGEQEGEEGKKVLLLSY